jgi:hypothetical protein
MQVLDQEFRAWQADLEARGFFKPSYMHVTCRLLEIVAIYALGCAALSVLPNTMGLIVACLLVNQDCSKATSVLDH